MADQNFHAFMSEKHVSNKLHRDQLQDDQALLDDSALLDTTRVRSDERWQESHRYETQLTDSSALLDNRTLLDASKLLGPPPSPPLVFRIKHRFGLPPTTHVHDLTPYLASEPSLALPKPFATLLEAPIPEPFHVALRLLASGKTATPPPHPCLIAGGRHIFSRKYRVAVPAPGSLAIGEGTGAAKVAECRYPLSSRSKTRIILPANDGGPIPDATEVVMHHIGWGRDEYFVRDGVRYEWRYDGKWWNSRRMTLYRILEDRKGEKRGEEVVRAGMSRKERKARRTAEGKEGREIVGRYFEGRSCRSGGTLVMVDEGGAEGEGRLDRVVGVASCLVMLKKKRMREAENNGGG